MTGTRMSARPVLIMAGGTGGHVFPALALARACCARSPGEVVWLGTRRGLEARLVPAEQIPIEWLTVSGLRGKGVLAWLVAPLLALALRQALRRFAGIGRAGGRPRWICFRPGWARCVAAAPAADDPRTECDRRLHQPLPGAPCAPRAGGFPEASGAASRRAHRQSGAPGISELPPPAERFALHGAIRF